jgi:hypothetical protein
MSIEADSRERLGSIKMSIEVDPREGLRGGLYSGLRGGRRDLKLSLT